MFRCPRTRALLIEQLRTLEIAPHSLFPWAKIHANTERLPSYISDRIGITNRIFTLDRRVWELEQKTSKTEHDSDNTTTKKRFELENENRKRDIENASAPHERISTQNRDKIDILQRVFALEGKIGVLEQRAAQVEHESILKKLLDPEKQETNEKFRERMDRERDPKGLRGEEAREGLDMDPLAEKAYDEREDTRGLEEYGEDDDDEKK